MHLGQLQSLTAKILSQRPLIEGKLDFKRPVQGGLQPFESKSIESFFPERAMIDERGVVEGPGACGESTDVLNLRVGVAEFSQGWRKALIDDFKITPTSQFFKLD